MTPRRHIALMADTERLDYGQRAVLLAIQRQAWEFSVSRCDTDPFAADRAAGRYDGIIAVSRLRLAARHARGPVPIVAVSRALCHTRMPRVVPDHVQAGRMAARHLIACGYPRFAYLGPLRHGPSTLQMHGFQRQLAETGRPCTVWRVRQDPKINPRGWLSSADHLDAWLQTLRPPVGVLAARDLVARALAQACDRRGLRIPLDVGIMGVGNDTVICDAPPVPLTSIDLDWDEIARRALALLIRLIGSAPWPSRACRVRPRGVIERRSTRGDADGDPLVVAALAWIADHCGDPIRVPDVAAAFGVPLRALQDRVAAAHPRTLIAELTAARLRRAEHLLLATPLPIAAIADACGYRTRRHLTRAFRQAHGLSPRAWRRAHRRRFGPAGASE